MSKQLYLLIDCNQFFVSCEQLFNPHLIGQPVVVLSGNDGCVVSRSKEAKALGIPMGAPAYQFAELFKQKNVHVFSSNFALYADMSHRVMQVLRTLSPDVEEYSIDEAFLLGQAEDAPKIKETVLQWTGIPVSIGIGPTKTLAKVANDLAKKIPSGILELSDEAVIDAHLRKIPPSDIWGVGSRIDAKLKEEGIRTALQLKNTSDIWLRKRFSVILVRTVMELRGVPAVSMDEVPEIRKSLTHARSFGHRLTELSELEEALSYYVASAAEKLRDEGLTTSALSIFITTSPFLEPPAYYANTLTVVLPEPTAYTPLLISAAKEALRQIYRPGFLYKKTGVTFCEISPAKLQQPDLFATDIKKNAKRERAMQLLDCVNHSFGKASLHFAAEGLEKEWRGLQNNGSSRYTTSWDELLTIHI